MRDSFTSPAPRVPGDSEERRESPEHLPACFVVRELPKSGGEERQDVGDGHHRTLSTDSESSRRNA